MTKEIWKTLLTSIVAPVLVGIAASVSTTYVANENTKPKLSGSILFVSEGFDDGSTGLTPARVITAFVALENQRDAAVTPIDYMLEYSIGGVWQSPMAHPDYRRHEKGFELRFDPKEFQARTDAKELKLVFPGDASLLTASLQEPILKTKTRNGLLMFRLPLSTEKIDGYRLTVVDTSERKYVIAYTSRPVDPKIILRLDPTAKLLEAR